MTKIESWVISVFARHLVALKTARLSSDSVRLSVKLSGMITVAFPLFIVLWIVLAVGSLMYSSDIIRTSFVLATLVTVFCVSAVSDRIYDRNSDFIRKLADEIKQDPKQGIWWARRSLLRIYVGYVMTVVATTVIVGSFA